MRWRPDFRYLFPAKTAILIEEKVYQPWSMAWICCSPEQVYGGVLSIRPGEQLADLVKRPISGKRIPLMISCIFPFDLEHFAELDGYFLDDLPKAERAIRVCVRDCSLMAKKNAEGLIDFMQAFMKNRK